MNFVFFHVVLIETGPRFFSVTSRNLVEIIVVSPGGVSPPFFSFACRDLV